MLLSFCSSLCLKAQMSTFNNTTTCAGDLGLFAAVYRFCHDTVQPPLPAFGSVLAEYAQWLPESVCQAEVATLVDGQAA